MLEFLFILNAYLVLLTLVSNKWNNIYVSVFLECAKM